MSDSEDPAAAPARGGRKGKEREVGKPARLARSRAACVSCHKAKQRCDGPPGPCHRCVTWSTECIFPSASGPVPSKTTLSRSGTPRMGRGTSPAARAELTGDSDVAEQLRVMNERLESLEDALSRAQFPPLPAPPLLPAAPVPPSQLRSQTGSDIVSIQTQQQDVHQEGSNAVELAGEAMAIEGLVDLSGPSRQPIDHDSTRPDVIARAIMSEEECEAEFDLYFSQIQPWCLSLSTTLDSHALLVRDRSPLLFHAILLTTLYYRPRTRENILLYRNVSSVFDSLLTPQILSPQPHTLTSDFIRAIHILLLYKPVQYDVLAAKGAQNANYVESQSKMNVRASWLLRLLVSKCSGFIGLPSIATTFAQAFANQHNAPIPEEIIAQQRLYLALIFHESHGALQSGKAANLVPQDACKTTRLFASLRNQPTDVRLAASAELVATLSSLLASRRENGVFDEDNLRRYDQEMDSWTEYWQPLLSAHDLRDPLAWSVFYPYASFSRLTVRGFAFNRWKEDKRARAAAGYDVGTAASSTGLAEEERENIAKAAKMATEMMLAVSNRGQSWRCGKRIPDTPWATEDLQPDGEVTKSLKMASDSLTCVMFSYPLIFLAKLANEGLLRSDLTVIPANSPTLVASPMNPTDKLCRLFLFGANLLEAIAPTPTHPAHKQAAFLRKVRDAAVSGRRSTASAPTSPRLGPTPNHSHQVTPQPPTFPPPFPRDQTERSAGDSFEFSLSASYQPTPLGSPRFGTINSTASVHADPFSALLDGVSPTVFNGADSFFNLDNGIDWNAMHGFGESSAGPSANGHDGFSLF
ncbi:Zn(II)2Cys6 transcription factor domain-containing protein [Sporobolomyces koalae]|uniref:Zn(II)2Cys6 transcription factor domain-containing protein n=1 Tax=Sporobolomyces koalae TaxID=500713 RepID=UPI00316DE167